MPHCQKCPNCNQTQKSLQMKLEGGKKKRKRMGENQWPYGRWHKMTPQPMTLWMEPTTSWA